MAETLKEVIDAFNAIDGIEAHISHTNTEQALVKVNNEFAVGKFFQTVRKLDIDRSRTNRNDLSDTVMDSWVSLK